MNVKHKETGHVCDAEMYEDGTWAVTDEAGDVQDWSWEGFVKDWVPVHPDDITCGDIVLTRRERPVGDLEPVTQGELAEVLKDLGVSLKNEYGLARRLRALERDRGLNSTIQDKVRAALRALANKDRAECRELLDWINREIRHSEMVEACSPR